MRTQLHDAAAVGKDLSSGVATAELVHVLLGSLLLLSWSRLQVPLLPVPWLLGDTCRCARRQVPEDAERQPLLDASEREQNPGTQAEPAALAATEATGQLGAAVGQRLEGKGSQQERTESA